MPTLDALTGQPVNVHLPDAERVQSVFVKQALLSTAFKNAATASQILQLVKGNYTHLDTLHNAVKALYTAKPAAAASLLAHVSIVEVAAFAKAAVAAQSSKGAPQAKKMAISAAQQTAIESQQKDTDIIEMLERSAVVDPVGFLHLERLQFTPVRYRKGDLMYSITLLPGETSRITHREWSRTDKEYTSLVSETIENEKDETNSEKSELTESSAAQQAHSMAFSASASLSGTYGFVSFAANAGLQASDQTTNTRQTSQQQSRETTRKASSRAKQEHKVTFKVSTAIETEDTSFRELTNPSDEAQQWNFHRMMREWQVDLYRYDIRLTYDITIPEPGSYLLGLYQQMQRLNEQIAQPMQLPLVSDVTVENFDHLQTIYNVLLEPPPAPYRLTASVTPTWGGQNDSLVASAIRLDIPDGYELDPGLVIPTLPLEAMRGWSGDGGPHPTERTSYTNMLIAENQARVARQTVIGMFNWRYTIFWTNYPLQGAQAELSVEYGVRPQASTIASWRQKVYAALVQGLLARQDSKIQQWTQQRDALAQQVSDLDTLQLRRLEREEIIKGVLRWILGPGFQFYPSTLPQDLLAASGDLVDPGADSDLEHGLYTTSGGVIDDQVWTGMLRYGQMISFLHEAVEWENVNYILYPYFWAEQSRWDLKQSLRHADDTHLEFLRSGAARVVITIRPGFETAWLRLADTGNLALADPAGDVPYLPIAQQVKQAAQTYQPHEEGVQPLDQPGLLIDSWTEWTPTAALYVERGGPLE